MSDSIENLRLLRKHFTGEGWAVGLLFMLCIGGIAIVAISLISGDIYVFLPLFITAGSSVSFGAILGFLFGIPRSAQTNEQYSVVSERTIDKNSGGQPLNKETIRYNANTNLEQISDWLTKILVGIGLTQLSAIPDSLSSLGNYISTATGGAIDPATIALGVCYFSVFSFLLVYLWTRLYLGEQLVRADLNSFSERVREAEQKVEAAAREIEEQEEIDARALSLVYKYLSPFEGEQISVDEMKQFIQRSSPLVRVQVFYRARQIREDYIANTKSRVDLEKTIAIFEALIESDPGRHHQNYGQLGLVLSLIPDETREIKEKAIEYLTKAIQIRGKATEKGYEIYELVRAKLRILLDPEFKREEKSSEQQRKIIINDLSIYAEVFGDLDSDEIVIKWLSVNEIKSIDDFE